MADIKLTAGPGQDGRQLKSIIRREMKISAGLLTKLKKNGSIRVNGSHVSVTETIREGDTICISLPEEKSESIEAVDIPLDIVYEDDYLLVINKPKDMPTHPSAGNRNNTVGNACMYYFRDTDFVFRPINRLDRDTTGLVVIAKDARTASLMSDIMQKGSFRKTYLAITDGIPCPESGIIDAPIGRSDESIIKREVREDGQNAITEYRVTETADKLALVEIMLHTGRTHQIRVHFAHIGTPLLYDYLYGKEIPGETLYLHCRKIQFTHPIDGKEMCLFADYSFPFFDSKSPNF